ncbi:MAG: hypothetical protein PHR82_07740 [Endomicrobiaceae bacterium]|nr:hypothetical protein [Endomicrobiaceae bacterium]
MNKSDYILGKVFMLGVPLIILMAVMGNFCKNNFICGFLFALWILLAIYLSIRLIISESFRETVLVKLTFIKERDEREVLLTGKATKTVFLTSLAILLLLFCLSCFQISIYRTSPEKAINGKTGVVSLGFNFSLLPVSSAPIDNSVIQKNIFSYTQLPISATAIILIMILWQIVFYNYSMRKLLKINDENIEK